MYCRFCGRETGSDKDVCEYCLNAQKQSPYNTADSTKYKTIIAVLIAVIVTGSITAGIFLKSGRSSGNTGSVSAQSSNPVTAVQSGSATADGETVVFAGEAVTQVAEASSYPGKTPYSYQGKTSSYSYPSYSSTASTSRYVAPTSPKTTTRTTAASTARPQVQPNTDQSAAPVQSGIKLTDSLQYDLNIFLSNFSESNVPSFSDRLSDEELANYGLCYNFINRQYLFESGDYYDHDGVDCNYRIEEHYVIETIKKYFDVTVSPGFAEGTKIYVDGYFYMGFTGAPLSEGFSIVSSAEDVGGNLYKVNFSIYMSGGNDEPYYGYTTQQIQSESASDQFLHYVCDGTAYIRATNIYDRSTYILDSYYVSR